MLFGLLRHPDEQKDRQQETKRQIERDKNIYRKRQKYRQKETKIQIERDKNIDRKINRNIDRKKDIKRKIDRYMDIQYIDIT